MCKVYSLGRSRKASTSAFLGRRQRSGPRRRNATGSSRRGDDAEDLWHRATEGSVYTPSHGSVPSLRHRVFSRRHLRSNPENTPLPLSAKTVPTSTSPPTWRFTYPSCKSCLYLRPQYFSQIFGVRRRFGFDLDEFDSALVELEFRSMF